jgi:hypothetical protein
MPPFDAKRYEEQVLKPLRRSMPHLPDDLLSRYAVEELMLSSAADDAALRERVTDVLRLWNKHAMRSTSSIGLVAQQLKRGHEELLAAGLDPTSARFWRDWTKERGKRLGGAINEVAARLKASHGALGVITRPQLRVAAAAHGSLGDAEIELAGQRAGLRIVAPLELPTSAGVRGRSDTLSRMLLAAGSDNVPLLLYPELTSFRLLDGLTVSPAPAGRVALDQRAAAERRVELEKLPDNDTVRAAKEAVGYLESAAKAGTDLRELALCQLLVAPRARRAEGADAHVLFALLTRARLDQAEAALLAVSVVAEQLVPVRDPAAAVTELLAEGKLLAADQAATTLTGPDADTAREAVRRQRARVAELRELAQQDLLAERVEQAASRLREAVRLAGDLPELAAELNAVPAGPVRDVTASPDGTGARVAWRPAPDHGADTVYRVLRGDGRPPVDPEDGVPVTGICGHAVVDPAPPVARPVHYAVFARAEAGRWSRPATASVRVVPPVTELRVEGGEGEVNGHWKVHPDVVSVQVRRSADRPDAPSEPIAVERNRTFRDRSAVDGVQYYYTLVACYLSVDGAPGPRSAPVRQRGATRLEAKPVTSLSASVSNDGGPVVRLSWRQRPGSEVVVRRGATPCPWAYGAAVPAAALESWGVALDGRLTASGESMTLVASLPPGLSYCVPFTLEPGGGVRGQDALVELIDPVRSVRAQRFGDDVRVVWTWPDAVSTAEVRWEDGLRRITRQQFRAEGGCQLRGVPWVQRVDVAAVLLAGTAEERLAPVVSVTVPGRPPRLSYQLARRGHRFGGGVRCTVTLSGAEPVPDVTVVLVGSAGKVMPLSPDGCVELLREPVAVRPGQPLVLPEVMVPSTLRKPYWLRCFLLQPASAILVDPPVNQLKVT